MLNKVISLLSSASRAGQSSDNEQSAKPETQSAKLEAMKPRTLDQMLRYRAQLTPNETLLWYPSSNTEYVPYTAAQINQYVERAAAEYSRQIPRRKSSKDEPRAIALLGLADLSYVITMFAIYRLGHTVVAHSPRLAKEAHEHLLNKLDTHDIIYHHSLSKMATALGDSRSDVRIHQLVQNDVYMSEDDCYDDDDECSDASSFDMDTEGKYLAVVIHSSGSTGLPKPTKLSHDTLIMAANKNMNMRAFSCVPFFHGFGLNGLHRGMYAGQEFYFYNASVPLTSKHLIDTIMNNDFEIFFCVPYALKLLAETETGIDALKKCKLVWFAGSACPDDLGDALTEKGIRLISDYGLSECGPLMTTMRPEDDHAWNYLRPLPHNKPYMKFEDKGEGMLELVCLDGMPWKVAENREDHSYATNDIFEKHPTIKDAYRFIARQDDTLVLSNGEKANPTVAEGKIRRHGLIAEDIIFGSGKTELGMLLIKSEAAEPMSDDQVLDEVWPTIQEAQKEMPEHARIVRSMVVTLPAGTEYPRTDKGTIIRQQVYKKFAQEIEDAYLEDVDGDLMDLDSPELETFLRREVVNALNLEGSEDLDVDTDLFSLGVDSLQSTQLRRKIQSQIDLKGNKLPINVVYENPTIRELCKFIVKMTSGNDNEGQTQSVQESFNALVEEYGNFTDETTKSDRNQHFVALTGSTGSLGAHLLKQLLQDSSVAKVYCLVRASSSQAASERVMKSLHSRQVLGEINRMDRDKIVALPADLAAENIGLDSTTYQELAMNITAVIHAAWPVNFNMSLASFKSDVVGTKNLIDLCLPSGRRHSASFTFCSSISTSMDVPSQKDIPESVPSDLTPTLDMGYAQSKLAAEHLCIRAAEQTGLKSYIMRIGQIVGDTQHGVWNATEAVPMMIQTAQTIGALPQIEEVHKWLPVDIVAKTILETSLPAQAPAGTVLNIVNPHGFKWQSDLLPALRKAGLKFEETTIDEWLQNLRESDQDGSVNPPIKLLSYFESVYQKGETGGRGEEHTWDTENASRYSSTFAEGWEMSEQAVSTFVDYWRDYCWGHPADTQRERQASWASDKTLEEEDSDRVDKGMKYDFQQTATTKEEAREQMYSELTRKSRMDSVATLNNEDMSGDKIHWNNEEKRFELQDMDTRMLRHAEVPKNDLQACYVKVDMNALTSGKVLAWTGTRFELRGSEEPPSREVSPSSSSSNTQPHTPDEPIYVPKEGELVWDGASNQFEIVKYSEDETASNHSNVAKQNTQIDMNAVKQPKEIIWDGTKFTCH